MRRDIRRKIQEVFGDPIGMYAGNPPAGARTQKAGICPDCGMFAVAGSCGCDEEWPGADSMPGTRIQRPRLAEGAQCSQCSMMEIGGTCECGMNEMDEVCSECGMNEVECECSMNQDGSTHMDEGQDMKADMEEVAPPGYEKVVKSLKKDTSVDNPWALAWWMKDKGIKPKKKR